tara:strand:+ start:5831 stop:6511 length:681 start_codon:yes stop_codon:yes gene_type:complete
MQINTAMNTIHHLSSNNDQYSKKAQDGVNFANVMTTEQSVASSEKNGNVSSSTAYVMDTNQGDQKINLENHLTPKPIPASVNLMDIPLLLPTAHNIDTLSKFSEEQFKGLLKQYDIPSPPETIEFDGEGKLVLPADYPYATELKQAFDDNPGIENALRTTAALASHYAGIMEGAAFRDEMSTARSQADQDRIVQKYSYLFDDNRPAAQIVLAFLEDGSMLVGEKNA